jgi:hypothetical protein
VVEHGSALRLAPHDDAATVSVIGLHFSDPCMQEPRDRCRVLHAPGMEAPSSQAALTSRENLVHNSMEK